MKEFNCASSFLLDCAWSFCIRNLFHPFFFNIFNLFFQILECDSPRALLSSEKSAFSKMVQSTGPANAEYLCSLALGGSKQNKMVREESKQLRLLVSSRWSTVVQSAIAVTLTSSLNELGSSDIEDMNSILCKTKDAVITLQSVLEGKHDKDIDESLSQFQVPSDEWWSGLYRIIEGKHFASICFRM